MAEFGGDALTMNLPKKIAAALGLALFASGWAGCQTHKTVTPIRNGYEEVAHPYHSLIDEPPPPRVAFQHRGADGTVTPVWPALYGVNEVIKGNLAIFVGDKGYISPEKETHARLFAVKSPDLPLDITDEILRRWSQATGKDLTSARNRFTSTIPEEVNGRLELQLEFWANGTIGSARDDWPERGSLQLEWSQVEDILRSVKARGTEKKDLQWNTPYIGEKF
jgi:hypothetical protein